MTDTYLPFCIRHDGPKNKRGYFLIGPTRGLELVEGEVKHSAEGYKQTMLDLIADPDNSKSWVFSIFNEGPPYQHYAIEDICWTSDGPENNTKYIGMEHEGRKAEPLMANQLHWTIEISKAIRELCPKVAANPPTRRVNLWEHRELPGTSTACPSGRIPWAEIITALEVDMSCFTPDEKNLVLQRLKNIDDADDALVEILQRVKNLDNADDAIAAQLTALEAKLDALVVTHKHET